MLQQTEGDMSRSLVQPVGQKRLTNVAVVRLKKHGNRFEIACYKNKVLSWRSHVEKDLDEVLQSQTVYSNVSKGVLAKSKDLLAAFGTDDHEKICLEILEKGELQVAGKERESMLSSQFRDIATIVMQKTFNPETQRPYTISMVERLMREIHFAVDPNKNSKQQALDVIRELQKQFPIKRSPMRLRLTGPEENISALLEKLDTWSASILSKDKSGTQLSVVCDIDPGLFRDCDALVRNVQGRLEILMDSVHDKGDAQVDHYDNQEHMTSSAAAKDPPTGSSKQTGAGKESSTGSLSQVTEKMQQQTLSSGSDGAAGEEAVKQLKCSTCNALVGDSKQYREHFKSEWHKHNLKRKTRQLPPLTLEQCRGDVEMDDHSRADLKDYSF